MTSPSDQPLSAADVLAFLDQEPAVSFGVSLPELTARYRQAAAVLAAIHDPDHLQPVGGGGEPGEALRLLGPELVRATGRKFAGQLMLRPESRQLGLRGLTSPDLRRQALAANPAERTGPVQEQLEKYLVGNPPPLDKIPPLELDEALQVAVWLDGIVEGVPRPDELRPRIAFQNLLAPFEALAGDKIFYGRTRELDQLRTYVGVLPPQDLLRRLADSALRWLRPDALPALSISGPGGVGKSALVARFMLEHARLVDAARLPFAYLDFDRPSLDISEPLGLLAEILRQLELQFPAESGFRKLIEMLPRSPGAAASRTDPARILSDMLGLLQDRLGPRPFIVVLDTFEEVQYRGELRAQPFWKLLIEMQKQWPFLRVILCGRAPADSLRLAGAPPQRIQLGDLEPGAAISFLSSIGITEPGLAAAIVRQVGGVPLSLRLAAPIFAAARNEKDVSLPDRSSFWFSASDEVIQGQLYERILDRLHNPLLARLAHPGLVLRRITPDVIFHVLNEPCRLALQSIQEAQVLFDDLRQESSLVTAESSDGSLLHRPDLRRVMLKLLVQKSPAQVEQIHRAAVAWYSGRNAFQQPSRSFDWRAKAEELYHRLQLGELVDKDEINSYPEIRPNLQASLIELPLAAQTHLASLGFQVSEEVLNQASTQQRESYLAERIEQILPYSDISVDDLQSLQLTPGERHTSFLSRAAARLYAQMGRTQDALDELQLGLQSALFEGLTLQIVDLASDQSWLLRESSTSPRFVQSLALLNEYAQRHQRPAALLQAIALAHWNQPSRYSSLDLRRILDTTSEADSLNQPGGYSSLDLSTAFRLLSQLTPADLWNIFPVLEPLVEPLCETHPGAALRLRDLILADSSPFPRVQFRQFDAARALSRLLGGAMDPGKSETKLDIAQPDPNRIARLVVAVCRSWPYRILSVQPPIGRYGFDRTESAILR